MKFTCSLLVLWATILCFCAPSVRADVTLTAATGGEAISADTAASTYTALTGPVLSEGATADIGTGSIVLTAPAGFEFDPLAAVTVTVTGSGVGNDVTVDTSSIVVDSSTISVPVTAQSDGSRTSVLTWSGITVRPVAGSPLASGTITESGDATFTLVSTPPENYGALGEAPGAATQLTVVADVPPYATAGIEFTNQPAVQISDNFGNRVTSDNTTVVTASVSSGTGLLSGTLSQQAINGLATFTNLSYTVAESLVLGFDGGPLTSTTSGDVDVLPGPAAVLNINTQPSDTATAGQPFAVQPVVALFDSYGNLVTNDNSTVVTATAIGGSQMLQGTTNFTAVAGVVTFTNLSYPAAETIDIEFTAGALTVDSSDIVVSGGAASQLVFTQEPGDELAGHPFATQPIVQVVDDNGNAATSLPAHLLVTVTLIDGTGYMFGQTTADAGTAAGNGFATFTNLQINTEGVQILAADASGLGSAVTDPFTTTGTVQPFADLHDYAAGDSPNAITVGNFRGASTARDLAIANHDAQTLQIRLSDDNGAFDTGRTYSLPAHPSVLRAYDINGDGYDDLVVAYDDTNVVTVLFSTGTHGTTFATAGTYPVSSTSNPGVSALYLSDVNFDGLPDLIVANSADNNISILYGTVLAGFGSFTNYAVGANPQWVHVTDLDRDGVQDIITANRDDGTISILYGKNYTNYVAQTLTLFPGGDPQPVRVTAPDIDRDGRPDLAIVNYASNTVSVLLQQTNGSFVLSSNYNVGTHPSDFFLRDLDGDGVSDLAVLNSGSGTVDLLYLSGTNYVNAATIPVGPSPVCLFGGKFHHALNMNGLVVSDSVNTNVSVLMFAGPIVHNSTINVDEDQEALVELTATNAAFPDNVYNFNIVTDVTNGLLSGSAPDLFYDPNLNTIGSDHFQFTADINGLTSAVATVSLNILYVNHQPSFSMASNVIDAAQGATFSIPGFITSQSPGPDNESSQTINYIVANPTTSFFTSAPTIDSTGTLTFSMNSAAVGTAVVQIIAHDDGGTARGGVDRSDPQNLTIVAVKVDHAPTVSPIATATTLEDQSADVLITVADIDDPLSNITITPVSENEDIVPTSNISVSGPTASKFTIHLTPAPATIGTATIDLNVSDGELSTLAKFKITVVPVNHASSFDLATAEVDALQDSATVLLPNFCVNLSTGPANESTQKLTFHIGNTNRAAFVTQPVISPTGTLKFRPKLGYVGTNFFTVYATDNGGTLHAGTNRSATSTFSIAVATNNFRHLNGTYNGLFSENSGVRHNSSGFITATVTITRTYSGHVTVEGGTYFMSGSFGTNGTAHATIPRSNKLPLDVTLQLDVDNDTSEMTGSVSDGVWTSDVTAEQQPTAPPTSGKYNIALISNGTGVGNLGGDAIGIATLTTANKLSFTGLLPGKIPISQFVGVSKDGKWPFYVSINSGAGSLLGWLTVTNDVQPVQSLTGVSIIKTNNHVGYYPNGYTNSLTIESGPNVPFRLNVPVISTSGTVGCSGANIVSPISAHYSMTLNDVFAKDTSTNKFAMSFDRTTGYLYGTFKNPTSGLTTPLQGLLINSTTVRGFFYTPTETGEFLLQGN